MSEGGAVAGGAEAGTVASALARLLAASAQVTRLSEEIFHDGSEYGDPDARHEAEYHLESARSEAERLFREYHDLTARQTEIEMLGIEEKMLKLQRSQNCATWASFAIAVAVSVATIASIVVAWLK